MANLPKLHRDDEFDFELYDASVHREEPLVWLLAEEDLALLDSPPQRASQLTTPAIALPVAVDPPERAKPRFDSPILSFPAAPFSYSLGEKSFAPYRSSRGLVRIAAVAGILLLGTTLPSILERFHPADVKASAVLRGSAAPAPVVEKGRILNVMASRDESVKDLSVRYAGGFDDEQFQEIRKLNPEVLDFDHLQGGELIKIPLKGKSKAQ